MKLTKMAGAFALTAAMAMAAVPAFAEMPTDAPSASNVEQFNPVGNLENNVSTATTEVYAQTINKYLDATIPTRVAIVVPSQGGAITAPSPSAYVIHNNTTTNPIYLKSVTSRAGDQGIFRLSATDSAVANQHTFALKLNAGVWQNIALDGTPHNAAASTGTPSIASDGNLQLELTGNFQPMTGTTLSASQLDSAVMYITYTIGTTANS